MDNEAVWVSDESARDEWHELMGHVPCRYCGVWMEPEQVALTVPGDGSYCAADAVTESEAA